jgi:phosphatidylglycerol:prolipoprotein diacylglycerol transferase
MGLHPTQVYELIFALIVFGLLMKLRGKLKPEGSLFMLYFGLYSAWRIGIGFLRVVEPFAFGLQQAQIIGIIIVAITIPLYIYRRRHATPAP